MLDVKKLTAKLTGDNLPTWGRSVQIVNEGVVNYNASNPYKLPCDSIVRIQHWGVSSVIISGINETGSFTFARTQWLSGWPQMMFPFFAKKGTKLYCSSVSGTTVNVHVIPYVVE